MISLFSSGGQSIGASALVLSMNIQGWIPLGLTSLVCHTLILTSILWYRYSYHNGFPGSSADEESTCNAEDPGSISGLGSSPGEGLGYTPLYSWASLVAQMVWETWFQSLGWEDALEEGMTTNSSFLA